MLIDLKELASSIGGQTTGSGSVTGIAHDSRFVQAGDAFIVIPCDQASAHIKAALSAGATALIAEPGVCEKFSDIPVVTVTSARRAVSQAAVLLYPQQPDVIVAVTGTNGKTSVAGFVRQIWEHIGGEQKKAASLGTLGLEVTPAVTLKATIEQTKLTTPDAITFHRTLNTLAESGVGYCAFEASSHGLDQYRLHGVRLTAAGFTNLTQDHLDYHGDMDAYFAAKAKLFLDVLPVDKTAVLNVESAYFPALKALITGHGAKVLAYGIDHEADIEATNVRLEADHMMVDLRISETKWPNVKLNLVGNFQVENVLCAMGLIIASQEEVNYNKIIETLPLLHSAPGRLEMTAKTSQGSPIFIDYAHTPDALSRALKALRSHVSSDGKIKVVFGCGGNRDAGKRTQMGSIAQTLADTVIVTDDNPRNEDPAYIRAQIILGCPKAQEVADRREAIELAIAGLGAQDILLIAGKGHEQGQIVGDQVIPFDDKEEVRKVLLQARSQ